MAKEKLTKYTYSLPYDPDKANYSPLYDVLRGSGPRGTVGCLRMSC